MLYRAILGIFPMILIAMFATGAIPLSSVVPTGEYRSSAVKAAEGEQAAKDEAGKPYRARTPEGVLSQHIGVIPNDAIEMMEENMEAVGKMKREMKKFEEARRQEARTPGWKPKSGGWGAQN